MEVRLTPPSWATHLISDITDWERRPLPVGELRPFEVPDDAWFEYAWLDEAGEPRSDPDGVPAHNPWWPHACRLTGPEHRAPADVPSAEATAAGRLERHSLESAHLAGRRRLFTYAPGPFAGPRPLVLLQDGKACWHYGRVGPLVDVLTAIGAIRPAFYAFLQPERRSREYAFHAPFREHVLGEVLPFLDELWPCDGERILWGASMGATASAWLALESPDTFGTVLSHSGAFLGAPWDAAFDPYGGGEWLLSQVRAGRGREVRWSLECGTLEWLIGAHRRLDAALREGEYEVRTAERPLGHHWRNWRRGLPAALKWALAPPV